MYIRDRSARGALARTALALGLFFYALASYAQTTPVINEIRIAQSGIDFDEYFELIGNPGASLDGLTYVVIGDGTGGSGVIEDVIDLSGNNIPADGFFVVTELSFVLGFPDLVVNDLNFENNDNVTHLLVQGFSGALGQDLDTNDDGVLDSQPWSTELDRIAVIVENNPPQTTEFHYGPPQVGPDGGMQPGHVFRCSNDTDRWGLGDIDIEFGTDTPGRVNGGCAPVVVRVPIYEIQGAGHLSPRMGEVLTTSGIVTAVTSQGFYMQDPLGDGNSDTSDGIFVAYSGSVSAGDAVRVDGLVAESTPGGVLSGNLSVTQITNASVTVESSGNPLPAPTTLGNGGRVPPTEVIDNDDFGVFDPTQDGIDFYESCEGMRVMVPAATAVGVMNGAAEVFVVGDDGAMATGGNPRGGVTVASGDFNPERIQIQIDADLLPSFQPQIEVGDSLGDVTGVMGYSDGNYEVRATSVFTVATGGLTPEITTLAPVGQRLTVASYNVANLDPNIENPALVADPANDVDDDIGDGRFTAIAEHVVRNLQTPDIVALQEIQDNDGAEDTGNVDASVTLQTLVDAIIANGGPAYTFVDNPPQDGQDGGQAGGNIRVAFLYNPNRVGLVTGSVQRITDGDPSDGDAFLNSRKPLAARFMFNGREITVVNTHLSSKFGSSPLFGQIQPPVNGQVGMREAQAAEVSRFVRSLLTADPSESAVVIGDMNEYDFESPLGILRGDPVAWGDSLTGMLPAPERYSFIFEGNSEALDHAVVSQDLLGQADYDVVHVNAEFGARVSDHDPVVASLVIEPPDDDDPATIDDILRFFDEAVASGNLGPTRGGLLGGLLLARYRLILMQARFLLEAGRTRAACSRLRLALRLADDGRRPRDWVGGAARDELERLIREARQALGCP